MSARIYESYYYPVSFPVRVVNAVIGFIQGAFILRILLQLLGANPGAQFVAWVYDVTTRLLGPFAGALPTFTIGGRAVLELSVILAMIGYSILGWLIIRLLYSVFLSPPVSIDYTEYDQRNVPLRGL